MNRNTFRGVASIRSEQGFNLLELMTVVAVLGILAAMAGPSMLALYEKQELKQSASQMAGLLSDARAHAVAEGTPYLVYFNAPTVDAQGNCGAAATEVKDVDHSYSITDGDQQTEFRLPASSCNKVTPYSPDKAPSTLVAVPMPVDDLASRAPDAASVGAVALRELAPVVSTVGNTVATVGSAVGGVLGSSGSGSSGSGSSGSGSSGSGSSGSGSSGSSSSSGDGSSSGTDGGSSGSGSPVANSNVVAVVTRSSTVAETVVDGATFPIDANSGRPVIAFSERGVAVNPADPTSFGSGAGGIYLTDGASSLTAALVAPLGEVQVKWFDAASNSWK
jgi:prepilin-type N-terminal cleavage/methylation domain-containing protein